MLLDESKKENQSLLSSLNTTIQEKDDVISNLKTELSAQLEKLTKIIEDNKNLNDQINLQAAEAKGQTDEVIKEMGEVNILFKLTLDYSMAFTYVFVCIITIFNIILFTKKIKIFFFNCTIICLIFF